MHRAKRTVGYDPAMLILALSEAAKTTIVYVIVWFVAFPALVTGLIGVALVQTYREWLENQENRRRPPT
jgi:hypothetical protein